MTVTRRDSVIQQELEDQVTARKENNSHQFEYEAHVSRGQLMAFRTMMERAIKWRKCLIVCAEIPMRFVVDKETVAYKLTMRGSLKRWTQLMSVVAVYDQRCDSLQYYRHMFYVPLGRRRKFNQLVSECRGRIDARRFGKHVVTITKISRAKACEMVQLAPPF